MILRMTGTPGVRVTRIGYILGILTLVWAGFMSRSLSNVFGPSNLPEGLTQPMLAMELAHNGWDATQILLVDPAGACLTLPALGRATPKRSFCDVKTEEMIRQQDYDRIFIVLYTLQYLFLAFLNIKYGNWLLRIIGVLILAGAFSAAWFDWKEDAEIVKTVEMVRSAPAPIDPTGITAGMRDPAYAKWLSISLATALVAPLFLVWRTPSLPLKLLRLAMGVAAAATAGLSALAFYFGEDQRIQAASGTIAIVMGAVLIFLMTVHLWREGTQRALDRIADWPILHAIADWPPDEQTRAAAPVVSPRQRIKDALRKRSVSPIRYQ